jgi:hypothetical protein
MLHVGASDNSQALRTRINARLGSDSNATSARVIVKAGNLQEAIKKYHFAILSLKFLASNDARLAGAKSINVEPKIADLSDDEEASQETQDNPDEPPKADKEDAALEEVAEDPYSPRAIKKVLTTCFVNMSICHAKRNAWSQCKRSAKE